MIERNKPMKLRRVNYMSSKAQETPNIRVMEMMKTIQDLRTEFSKDIETLKGAQHETKMKLKTQ